MIDTLYISHQNFDWNSFSEDRGIFVNKKSIKKLLINPIEKSCHTTLEDCNLKLHELKLLLDSCHNVCLVDLTENFINKTPDTSLYLYLNFFKNLKKNKDADKIQNFDWYGKISKNTFIQLKNRRLSDDKCMWITGCSITHGVGVAEKERYPILLKEKLGWPMVDLSEPSSIAWQADQLLRSDICKGDIVVWGLTSFNRVNYADGLDWKICSIRQYLSLPKSKQYWSIDYFNSATQSIPCIKNILQVMNFCKKMGATLYLINILETTWTDYILGQEENYLDLTVPFDSDGHHTYLDLGTDNSHPGPKQHLKYAEEIYNFIKEKNHGKTI
jgi:hypothetical protein